ncbi:hypothetical protein AB1Y20_000484 [Prymnesium parvum]|uniref:Uncharacterized protein n=1 Tax=Prymnesium parvum TaxID=97485 RepID=A0AB34KAJ4_PRYPA
MGNPLTGRRVVVEGIVNKVELNGKQGVALSFDDSKGRYNVRLDSGEISALKPANLRAVPESDSSSGFSGAGGMPGMGGMSGMAGMGGMGSLFSLLSRMLQQGGAGGMRGLTPQQLGMGALAVFMLLRMSGINLLSLPGMILAGAGAFVYQQHRSGGGTRSMLTSARSAAKSFGTFLSGVTGFPVSETQAFVIIASLIFLCYRYLLSDGGVPSSAASERYEAYTKGFQDGSSGAKFDPIRDIPDDGKYASANSEGFGLSKMMSIVMVGSMIYQLGGGGSATSWSFQNVLANARNMNPLNLMIVLNMLSGLLW